MTKNLLVVFGGTTQSEPQGIFTPQELSEKGVDVLQINLLTTYPNVTFSTHTDRSLNELTGTWVEAKPSSIVKKRNLKATINHAVTQEFHDRLKDMADIIEDINWSDLSYTEGSTMEGMNVKAFNEFSQRSKKLILVFLSYARQHNHNYDNVFMLAHSRGCSLAIHSLSDRATEREHEIENLQLDNNLLTQKLNRIVLLDPVGKNVWSTDEKFIIPGNSKIVKILSQQNKEIHIISKSKSTSKLGLDTNYQSYVDRLVGTKLGNKNNNSSESPDMSNIYVHIAQMAHEGMLSNQLRDNFQKYQKIISAEPWTTIYSNGEAVQVADIQNSPALQEYLSGLKSASEISPTEADPLCSFYKQFDPQLKDRRRAFVHCLAQKVRMLSR